MSELTIDLTVRMHAVGGQLLAAMMRQLARRLARQAHALRIHETHGMAQRGGVVLATLVAELPATRSERRTVLIGLERIEGARGLVLLRPGDMAFIATGVLLPPGAHQPAPDTDHISRAAAALGVELRLIDADVGSPGVVVQAAIESGAIP